jgi:fructuronate reductase
MPDTPQRIATDTSQKLSIRFGETVKAYLADPALKVADLKLIPLVYAGWLRYLMAVDDTGAPFELSPDPLTATVKPVVDAFKLGDAPTVADVEVKLKDLLSNAKIFGVDLFQAGLADTVAQYFIELIAAPGAIRATLKKYTA